MPSSSSQRITPDRVVLAGVVLSALVYLQDIRYDFILDDIPLILVNEAISSWRNWKMAFTAHIFAPLDKTAPALMGIGAVHYRPIYKLWQMLNFQLFGAVIPWWHLTSLLLHVAATLLVYQLGIKLLKERWAAALAALLFAFHPIHAESVAYVTASTDLLVAVFGLLAFLAYFRFREEGASRLYYFASVFAAALAMLSKESAVMLPWLLVAYEALRDTAAEPRQSWRRYVWTVPFFAVVGAYVLVRTLLFGLNAGPGPGGSRVAALLDIPLVLVVYLHNLLWPFRLSFFYPSEWGTGWTLLRVVAVGVVAIAAALLWRGYGDRAGVRLQLTWAALLFVPALLGVYTFVHDDWVHDRHMYFASVPLCLVAAAILTDSKWPAKASAAVSSVVLAILLINLAVQLPRFSDNTSIYASAVQVAPRSLLVHSYYAEALWSYGHSEEALREYKLTTEIAPRAPSTHEGYGTALARLGRDDEAMAEYRTALRYSPRPTPFRAFLLSELVEVELRHADFSGAADHMREAVQIAPQTLNYHSLFAQALSHEGRAQEAAEQMELETGVRRRVAQEQRTTRE